MHVFNYHSFSRNVSDCLYIDLHFGWNTFGLSGACCWTFCQKIHDVIMGPSLQVFTWHWCSICDYLLHYVELLCNHHLMVLFLFHKFISISFTMEKVSKVQCLSFLFIMKFINTCGVIQKTTSPRKCQILDPLPLILPLTNFFIIPTSPCHQANSDTLLP